MLPPSYQTHLQKSTPTGLSICLLISLLPINQTGETWKTALATALPLPITFARVGKSAVFLLSLPQLTLEKIWFPILQNVVKTSFAPAHVLCTYIDRTKWGCINLLMN